PCPPPPATMAIGYGDLVTCSLGTGEDRWFVFDVNEAEHVVVSTSRLSGGSASFTITDNHGNKFGEGGGAWEQGIAFDLVNAPAGPYTIRMYEASRSPVTFTLNLDRVAPVSPGAVPLAFDRSVSGLA